MVVLALAELKAEPKADDADDCAVDSSATIASRRRLEATRLGARLAKGVVP